MNIEKQRKGWYIYDWAISAFSSTVITVFIGPYLKTIADNAAVDGLVKLFFFNVSPDSYFGYIVSLSVIFQVILLPYLGVLSDKSNKKIELLLLFTVLGSFSTMSMYFIQGNNYELGGLLLFLANLSFGAAMVIYNAFLNDLAGTKDRNRVSAFGWGIGYVGGGVLLLLNLLLFSNTENLGIETSLAVRLSLSSAGVWWLGFSVFTFLWLKNPKEKKLISSESGYKQFFKTLKELKGRKEALKFLIAYLFYNDGVQAVITFAALFGAIELGLEQSVLTSAILMVQFVAFLGSIMFERISRKISAKNTILISLVIWVLSLLYAYHFAFTATDFFILAFFIALVLGGTQALSRSVFSIFIPPNKEAEYFSLYEISERGTSWVGYFIFALALDLTASYRVAIISLIILFVIGGVLLFFTKIDNSKSLNPQGDQSDF